MTTRYALDKSNGKLLGVCAGLARTTGWDPTLVRIGTVALSLFVLGPLAILLYVLIAFIAEAR
jgi:phage shock protein C